MPDQPEGTAARAEALARAETGLVLATLAPFAMLIPILVVLGWWDRGTTVIDAVVSAVAVPILTAVFATAVPFAFAMQRFGNDAYSYDLAAQETRPVDWAAPKWAPVGEVVTSLTGLPATSVPAVFLITPTANLAVVHRPSQAPGRLGRASDWSVRHRRPLMAAGAVLGVVAAFWPDNPPAWLDAVTGTLLAVAAVGLLPLAAVGGRALWRRNIRDPRLLLVIPTLWTAAFRKNPQRARVLLGHELSHLRHRDALHRRVLAPYRAFAPVLAFVDSGVVFCARIPAGVQMALLVAITTVGVTCVRRAHRLYGWIQEERADAEACADRAEAKVLADALAGMLPDRPSDAQARRFAALRGAAATGALPAARRVIRQMLWGFALPCVTIAILVLTGVLPVDLTTVG